MTDHGELTSSQSQHTLPSAPLTQPAGLAAEDSGVSEAVKEPQGTPTGVGAAEDDCKEDSAWSWHQAWYPVAPESYLEKKLPNSITVLGIRFVVWLDSDGIWRAARDECPHRSDAVYIPEVQVYCDDTLCIL